MNQNTPAPTDQACLAGRAIATGAGTSGSPLLRRQDGSRCPQPPQGGHTCGPAQPVPRSFWTSCALVGVSVLVLTACGNNPPAPGWQLNAKGSSERAAQAWLGGDSRVEAVEFARARHEVASTGRADLVARLELLRCATRVAALVFEPCTGFEALAADAAPAEQAYARYLAGQAQPADAALLVPAHRPLVARTAAPEGALASIDDPLSRLVAAGVLLRRGEANPAVLEQAVQAASSQGWRRPLLAWLQVQAQRARAGGAEAEAGRLQRRIDLLLEPPR